METDYFMVEKLLRLGIVYANFEDDPWSEHFCIIDKCVFIEKESWEQFSFQLMCSKGRITKFYFSRKIKFQVIFPSYLLKEKKNSSRKQQFKKISIYGCVIKNED